MARKKAHRHVGSDFEEFLREDKRLEAATALALKRVLAWEFQQAMEKAQRESGRNGPTDAHEASGHSPPA